MLQYLSDEWVQAMDEALRAAPTVGTATTEITLVIRQTVQGGPLGLRAYDVRLDHGAGAVTVAGPADPPADVTFLCEWATAVAIAQGTDSAQAAFMEGRLKLGGDSRKLMAATGALAGMEEAFAAVRDRTDYSG